MKTEKEIKEILDQLLYQKLKPITGLYVAGGCFCDWLQGRDPKDIDVFFKDAETRKKAIQYLAAQKIRPAHSSQGASNFLINGCTVQFITGHYHQTPGKLISCFDFTVCGAVYDGVKLHTHKDFFRHIVFKELCLVKDEPLSNPVGSFYRAFRYVKKGFDISDRTLWSIAASINDASAEDLLERFYEDH